MEQSAEGGLKEDSAEPYQASRALYWVLWPVFLRLWSHSAAHSALR